MILDGDGNVIRCDRCGKVHDFKHGDFQIKQRHWLPLFCKIEPTDDVFNFKRISYAGELLNDDFCLECAIEITPIVHKLADVMLLNMYVNKLERTIYETRKQRTKNHRAATDDACECCQRCAQRRSGHRSCDGTSQAGEEHF